MSLKSRVAVVTGAGSGLGAEIARRFAAEGDIVVVADVNPSNAGGIAEEIRDRGGRASAVAVDVTNEAQVRELMGDTSKRHGRLDILVSSAGIGIQKKFVDTTLEEWNRILSVNLTGAFLCAKYAALAMIPNGFGRIINIASGAGVRGVPGRSAYGASKGGLITLTQVVAAELGAHGITSNAIAPGPVETALTGTMHTEETRRAYVAAMPVGRYGWPREIASAASYLASDDAAFITGHTILADGGMMSSGPLFKV